MQISMKTYTNMIISELISSELRTKIVGSSNNVISSLSKSKAQNMRLVLLTGMDI